MSIQNPYTDTALDRMDAQRSNALWLKMQTQAENAHILVMQEDRHLVNETGQPIVLSVAEGAIREGDWVFLGLDEQSHPWFTVSTSDSSVSNVNQWYSLRQIAPLVDGELAARLAYARAMTLWHASHHFCPACGAMTTAARGGHQRDCANCGAAHFPRINPAVIMLITDGDHCLLGRQSQWPQGRYSVLAGYVEPGESLEGAVAREVQEEAGISIENIRYHSSQAWPFPGSLMIGFTAHATSREIRLNDHELEDAQWVHRDILKDVDCSFDLPPSDSIAWRLVQDWLIG